MKAILFSDGETGKAISIWRGPNGLARHGSRTGAKAGVPQPGKSRLATLSIGPK
jgi:hypothetical protein